jgi:hypothetical protein
MPKSAGISISTFMDEPTYIKENKYFFHRESDHSLNRCLLSYNI